MEGALWSARRVPGEVELAVGVSGAGPDPVVCLHGITAHYRAFNAPARELQGSRPLAGVDLRGRGDSAKPPSGYGLDAHADDVARVIDHLGLGDAVLAGHSMGAFVALRLALRYPERVRALVLLDGGWPRVEGPPGGGDDDAVEEGLARAFGRLERVFGSPEEYLDFWFPGRGLSPEDLHPDVADYYLYDLAEVEGGYNPKASLAAVQEDRRAVEAEAPTLAALADVRCPVALVMAAEGFFPGTEPLISDDVRADLAEALDLRRWLRVDGATHYTLLWPEHAPRWAHLLRDDGWF